MPRGSAQDNPPPFEGRELRRVLLGPPEPLAGVRVSTVELYDDGVLVRSSFSVERSRRDDDKDWPGRVLRATQPLLSDDVGTDYEHDLPASGGGHAAETGDWVNDHVAAWSPGVPPGARRVSVATQLHRVEFDLASAAVRIVPLRDVGAAPYRPGLSDPSGHGSLLRRAAIASPRTVDGFRVTAVEAFRRAVFVHWLYTSREGEHPAADAAWEWATDEWARGSLLDAIELEDDAGTAYRAAGSSYGFAHPTRTVAGHFAFRPSPPANVAHLRLRSSHSCVSIDLGAG